MLKISDGSMFIPKKDTPFKVQGSSEDMESKEKRLFRAFKSRKKRLKISSSEEYTAIVIRKYSISKLKIDSSVFVQK